MVHYGENFIIFENRVLRFYFSILILRASVLLLGCQEGRGKAPDRSNQSSDRLCF